MSLILLFPSAGAPPAGKIKKIVGVDWAKVKRVGGIDKVKIKRISGVSAV